MMPDANQAVLGPSSIIVLQLTCQCQRKMSNFVFMTMIKTVTLLFKQQQIVPPKYNLLFVLFIA